MVLTLGGTTVAHCTNLSKTVSVNMRPATTKSSAGWEEVLPGLRSSELSGDFFFSEDGNLNYEDIFDHITNRTAFAFIYGTGVSGDKKYHGSCYVTSVNDSHPVEDTGTFNVSLKVTGAVTKSTIS